MLADRRARAHERLQANDIHRALLANPTTVTWLTGVAPAIQTGPSPFSGGPPIVWYEDGSFVVVAQEGLSVEELPLVTYPGIRYDQPRPGADQLAAIVRELVAPASGEVAIEAQHLPAFLAPDGARAVDGLLEPLRRVKDADEIEILRRCFALTDLAHAAARGATRPGMREIDVWAEITSAVERAEGERVPLGNDCVVSYRENNIGGWPGDLVLREGDSLMVDLSVRLRGYWSDSCATYYAGEPNERQRSAHRMAAEALAYGISLIRPGAIAGEIDQQVRQFIADAGYPVYPHHTGHGIGILAHEEPRIVPGNEIPLEPGMVIMLEPGIYFPGELAVRLEDALLVTEDGAEILTTHDKELP